MSQLTGAPLVVPEKGRHRAVQVKPEDTQFELKRTCFLTEHAQVSSPGHPRIGVRVRFVEFNHAVG